MMLSIMPDSCLLYMAHLSEIARHSRNPGGGSQYYTIVLAVLGLLVALWVCWGLIAKLRGAGANGAGVEQTSLLELIAVADRRLYRAKAEGRNRVVGD